MANISIPSINPIRLHKVDEEIDYISVLPNADAMRLGETYQRGIYPVQDNYRVLDRNGLLSFQFLDTTSTEFTSYFKRVDTFGSGQFIVPTRYLDYVTIQSDSLSSFDAGIYILSVIDLSTEKTALESDLFYFTDWSDKKDLVKIEFNDTRNRQGGYFYKADGSSVWSPEVYYNGFKTPTTPVIDKTSYTGDGGSTVDLQNVTQRAEILTLTDISNLYINVIADQLACDTIKVNDIEYSASNFESTPTENSDIVNITVLLTQKNNNHYANY